MSTPLTEPAVAEEDPDHPMQLERASSQSDSGSDSGDDSDEDEQVEWLVNNREKRTTAGNRLSTLIQQAAAEDDELNLLFEEPEDEVDEGFEVGGDEEVSDVQMDSSDDDDDQGPTAGAEELEGEKELQRAERQSKKRKANDGIPKAFRKRVKIDPTAPLASPPQPKKKSERASWIPTVAEGPTRASARSTTKESKEQLHAQMIEREVKRLKQLKSMEKAAATRNANKAKELTQEDRLREAARIEKYNAKSLNKWEEAEKLREEERRQKLEDLHNRQLEGPVLTWWSGMAEWVNGKLHRVGKVLVEEKPKATTTYMTKKRRAELEAGGGDGSKPVPGDPLSKDGVNIAAPALSCKGETTSDPTSSSLVLPALKGLQPYASTAAHSRPLLVSRVDAQKAPSSLDTQSEVNDAIPGAPVSSTTTQLANLPAQELSIPSPATPLIATIATPLSPAPDTALKKPTTSSTFDPPPASDTTVNKPATSSTFDPPPASDTAPNNLTTTGTLAPIPAPPPWMVPSPDIPFTFTSFQPQPVAPVEPVIEHSTRNCIILENFDEAAIKDKGTQTQILFGRNTAKVPKVYKTPKVIASKEPACVVTGYQAKFRDPGTGLPYYNSYAYKEIQKLKRGDFKWSSLLQAYVGSQYAARGVPPRFLERRS